MRPFFLVLLQILFVWNASAQPGSFKKMVVLGDSLTEGYGVTKDKSFPALLERKIKATGKTWTVVNAGISGSTSASAVSRMKWILKTKPQVILLALGANDGLRGVKAAETKKNLSQAIDLAKKENVTVVLCGMLLPPNYGKEYREQFQNVFRDLAKQYQLKFIPFLLENVAGDPKLNLPDGVHPNEKGYEIVAENVFQGIREIL